MGLLRSLLRRREPSPAMLAQHRRVIELLDEPRLAGFLHHTLPEGRLELEGALMAAATLGSVELRLEQGPDGHNAWICRLEGRDEAELDVITDEPWPLAAVIACTGHALAVNAALARETQFEIDAFLAEIDELAS
jgi:hypothetical protein